MGAVWLEKNYYKVVQLLTVTLTHFAVVENLARDEIFNSSIFTDVENSARFEEWQIHFLL